MKSGNHSYRVLVVGCGNLGIRHLQAVAALPMVREIEVVDPKPEALEGGRRFLSDMPKRQSPVSFRWVSSIEEASPQGDLCIVVTHAKGRAPLVCDIASHLGYRAFLIEKVVSQSAAEYDQLLSFSKAKKLSIWVNCKSRAYPIHKYIKRRVGSNGPIVFSVVGGNFGLANNGVHSADLFVFYDETKALQEVGASIDPILHPSKRGAELFDLSGTLQASTAKGSHFTLSFAANHNNSDTLSLYAPHYRCIVDHMQRWAVESDAGSDWNWRPIPFEGNLLVSHMTKQFVTDILREGRCELPKLEDCYPAHRFILNALRPHFNQLLHCDSDLCPVT